MCFEHAGRSFAWTRKTGVCAGQVELHRMFVIHLENSFVAWQNCQAPLSEGGLILLQERRYLFRLIHQRDSELTNSSDIQIL
jgi:hypothetical protein